jgi:hypothetical protein
MERSKGYSSELSFEISCTKEFLKTTSSSECSLVSDLTETLPDTPNNNIDSV